MTRPRGHDAGAADAAAGGPQLRLGRRRRRSSACSAPPALERSRMQELLRPIEFLRPASIAFGPGTVAGIAGWAQARGLLRPLGHRRSVQRGAHRQARVGRARRRVRRRAAQADVANFEAALAAANAATPTW